MERGLGHSLAARCSVPPGFHTGLGSFAESVQIHTDRCKETGIIGGEF